MLKKITLLTLFIYSINLFSQGEANNWYFGANAGLDFSSGNPVPISGGQINTTEGCSTISDSNGDLLFYTDGITVWDKNHNIMLNGTGLNGDPSSTSSAIIVPKPNDSNIYYIFTVDEPHHNENENSNHGLNYTTVDISLNGGNGAVVTSEKNIALVTYNPAVPLERKYKCAEKITAVKSSDCNSFWVVTHFINNFYSFEVTVAGVNNTPIISPSQASVPISGYRRNALGYIKNSPDGSKLAVAHYGFATTQGGDGAGGTYLYDFDPATGVVTNEQVLYSPNNGNSPYGVEFSSSGEKLYTTVGGSANGQMGSELVQYDLTSTNIPASQQIINSSNLYSHGALQLAPDGKIYRALFNFNANDGAYLGVINEPENIGQACNYIEQGIALNLAATPQQEASRIGLPPFIQSLFAPKVDIINTDNDPNTVTNTLTLCEGDTFTLNTDNLAGATYTWTQNGNAIPTPNPANELIVNSSGTYIVEVNPNNGDCPYLGEAIVTINPKPVVNSLTPLEACFDSSDGISTFNLPDANNEALANQPLDMLGNSNVTVVSYHSSEANALAGTNPIASSYDSTGETIYIKLLNSITNCTSVVPLNLVVNPLPIINSPVTLEQCDDDTDGFTIFNLEEANVLLSSNSANETFTYFNTLADAQNNSNTITNPTAYTSNTGNDVFVRVISNEGCVNYGQINLVVGTTQIPPNFLLEYSNCDDNFDGITIFDFSNASNQILGLFPGNNNINISYYENQNDALIEVNAIQNISNYQNTTPNTQEIWVRIDSNDVNACLGLGHHITLNVNPLPATNILNNLQACSDTALADFDLSNNLNDITGGDTNLDVSYHSSLLDAQNNQNPLNTNLNTSNTTIFVRAENTITNCVNTFMQFDLIVNPNPDVNTLTDRMVCDDETSDGLTEFDLTNIVNEATNNTSHLVTLHETLNEATNNSNPLDLIFTNTVAYNQTIYVRVTNTNTNCFSTAPLNLIVSLAPQGFPLSEPLTSCDPDNDGFSDFNLTSIINQLTGNNNGVTVNFYSTLAQAESGDSNIPILETTYTNVTPSSQTIYAQLSIPGLNCTTIIPVNLLVLNSPILNPQDPYPIALCDDNDNDTNLTDGLTTFD
ncbi:hypothetical protein ACFQ1O_07035, partial [Pseudofulvibacter geojedonensis]